MNCTTVVIPKCHCWVIWWSMLEVNARFVQKGKHGWAEHATLRYSSVQDITVNSAFFSISSEGDHEASRTQQLDPRCHSDGWPVFFNQPVLHSHRGHPTSERDPPTTSGPTPSSAVSNAAPCSHAPKAQPPQSAWATQPTHWNRLAHTATFLRTHSE